MEWAELTGVGGVVLTVAIVVWAIDRADRRRHGDPPDRDE